jgi:hypothetical protein
MVLSAQYIILSVTRFHTQSKLRCRVVRVKKMMQDFVEAEHLSSKDLIQFQSLF